MTARLQPTNRQAVIITAAVSIAKAHGLHRVTHGDVAKLCRVQTSQGTVRHYFNRQTDLWLAVVAADPSFAAQGKELGL